jgi:hypothetical protein
VCVVRGTGEIAGVELGEWRDDFFCLFLFLFFFGAIGARSTPYYVNKARERNASFLEELRVSRKKGRGVVGVC